MWCVIEYLIENESWNSSDPRVHFISSSYKQLHWPLLYSDV